MSNKKIDLSNITEEELLGLRIRDLSLTIKGTWLEECIEKLYAEIDAKGVKFKPPCYLADEWLTPEHEPNVGIPFFLADPILMKLEHKMVLEVEGGTKQWCEKLLRHEAGHAINYAYQLYKRKKWRKIFGRFSTQYLDTYRFRPYSKNFVRHLEDYYAQYHPDEDFAETFAVWLTPDLDWRVIYEGWGALKKLEFVEGLMAEIKNKEPLVKKGKKYWDAAKIKTTLRNYYKKKRHFYAEDFPDFHDANLKRIFIEKNEKNIQLLPAYDFMRKYRKNILQDTSIWTGEKKYIIDDLLKKIVQRCKELKLLAHEPESLIALKISAYVTTLIMNYIYTGRLRGKKCLKN
ncbi:MAG: hypothetical protein ABIC18_03060 [Candidatus Omnitrophota bacterium]